MQFLCVIVIVLPRAPYKYIICLLLNQILFIFVRQIKNNEKNIFAETSKKYLIYWMIDIWTGAWSILMFKLMQTLNKNKMLPKWNAIQRKMWDTFYWTDKCIWRYFITSTLTITRFTPLRCPVWKANKLSLKTNKNWLKFFGHFLSSLTTK